MLNYKKPAFWVIIAAIVICIVLGALFLTNPPDKWNTDDEPVSASYRVAETIYDISWFDFTENENNAPQYFTDGETLYWNVPEAGKEMLSTWTEIGPLTKVSLDSDFDSLFHDGDWIYGYSLEQLKQDNKTAYKTVKGEDTFWILTQKDGAVLLCRQFEDVGIRWVQRLGRTDVSTSRYYRYNNPAGDTATVALNMNGTFTFSYSLYSSYLCVGNYTETDNYILLMGPIIENSKYDLDKPHSDEYRFKKSGDNLIFDAESSDAVAYFTYASGKERCVPDGAVFEPYTPSRATEPIAGVDITCELAELHITSENRADPYVTVKWTNLSDFTVTIPKTHLLYSDWGSDYAGIESCDNWIYDNDATRPVETVTIQPHSTALADYHYYNGSYGAMNPTAPGNYRLYLAGRNDLYIDYTVEQKWPEGKTVKWFDTLQGDTIDNWLEKELDVFPKTSFRCNGRQLEVVSAEGVKTLCGGMEIVSVYFSDVIGSGYPQLCVNVKVDADIVGHRIFVIDYSGGMNYAVEYEMTYDYVLNLADGRLVVEKRYKGEDEIIETGILDFVDGMVVYRSIDNG